VRGLSFLCALSFLENARIRLNVFEARSYVLIYFGVMVGSLVTLFAPNYASAVS
jgi:hypothetical protein